MYEREVVSPRTWLLSVGWRKAGDVDMTTVPAPAKTYGFGRAVSVGLGAPANKQAKPDHPLMRATGRPSLRFVKGKKSSG